MSPFPEPLEAPTEEELQAAQTLVELADLILLLGQGRLLRSLPESLSWAARKPRSLPFRRRLYHPLFPPPHPSPVDDKERGIGAAAARSSPATPLSFQESGSEDAEAPRHQQLERCEKWVKPEQEMMMVESLSNSMSNPGREPQQEKLPIGGGGGDLLMVDPTASGQQQPATITMGPDWGRHGVEWPARAEDQTVGGVMDGVGIPDLNVTPEEAAAEDWVWGWEQQLVAYKATTSALARRRRLLIQRKKRSTVIPLRK